MITMQSWMFLGNYERMREGLLKEHSIATMAHLDTRAFDAIASEVVSTTATVFGTAASDAPSAYFRLVDMGSEEEKRTGLLRSPAYRTLSQSRLWVTARHDLPGDPSVRESHTLFLNYS